MEREKVLIIDEDKDFCLLMSYYLEKKNYDVYYCHELEEGLEDMEMLRPSVIIADLRTISVQKNIELRIGTIEGYSPAILNMGTPGSLGDFLNKQNN